MRSKQINMDQTAPPHPTSASESKTTTSTAMNQLQAQLLVNFDKKLSWFGLSFKFGFALLTHSNAL